MLMLGSAEGELMLVGNRTLVVGPRKITEKAWAGWRND